MPLPVPIYRLVYVRAASELFSKAELLALLAQSREKNKRLGVSGLLLYRDGYFIQLFEGDRGAALQDVSRRSAPHAGHVLIEEDSQTRLFPDWSMGFRDLSRPAVRAMQGFSQFRNTRRVVEGFGDDPADCLALLSLFQPL